MILIGHGLCHYTPGRGNVIIEMFDYFGMAYRDSDFTVVIVMTQ